MGKNVDVTYENFVFVESETDEARKHRLLNTLNDQLNQHLNELANASSDMSSIIATTR